MKIVQHRSKDNGFYLFAEEKQPEEVLMAGSVEVHFETKYGKCAPKPPTIKTSLPNRRSGHTQKFHLGEITVYLRTGEYPEGSLGEIFIDLDKTGTTLRATMNCFAIMVSMALQHGVPLEKIADKFLHTKFEPAGMVQCSEDIKQCASIIDLIFKDLAIHYLGREKLKNA